jgi:hypothetical protein
VIANKTDTYSSSKQLRPMTNSIHEFCKTLLLLKEGSRRVGRGWDQQQWHLWAMICHFVELRRDRSSLPPASKPSNLYYIDNK